MNHLLALLLAFVMGPNVIQQSQAKVVEIEVHTSAHHGYIGSGAYISPDGMVLTCAHLFTKPGVIIVRGPFGSITAAQLVRLDAKHDLAIIKTFPVKAVPFFVLGRQPNVGNVVYAFGSPLGFQGTVSKGIVENVHVGKEDYTMHGAGINPGNSGGPLVNAAGELVGVNVSTWMIDFLHMSESLGNAVAMKYILQIIAD